MATIDNNKKICTLINVFTVDPEKQMELFEGLKEASKEVMCKMPGYISANIHLGDNGKTVTNYAQWTSLQDYQNVLINPEVMEYMKTIAAIAIEFKPVTYNTIWTDGNND